MTFKDFKLKDYIYKSLNDLSFTTPTKIQELIIPKVLKNQNVIGKSSTGTGKTHSFLIPIVQKLDENLNEVQSVIISPTRELALQLYNETMKLLKYVDGVDVRLYVGGSNRDAEIKRLESSQPQIVIGTIGKIKDLGVESNILKIHTCKTVV